MPSFRPQEGSLKTDVLIIGGGMAGILCALRLDQEGVDYALIEADRICRGVTGNTTAKITSQHGPIYRNLIRRFGVEGARRYWLANEQAVARYREIGEKIRCDFRDMDSYIYETGSGRILEEELIAMKAIGARGTIVRSLPIPIPVVGAIRCSCQAQFHPLKFVSGVAKNLNIHEDTKALEFLDDGVITNRGRITCRKIIVATHFPILNKHGGYFLKLYQSRSYVLALKNAENPDGMYLGVDGGKYSFRSAGEYLLLGGGGHRTGKKSEGWTGVERIARIGYPEGEIVSRWATQDCISLDGMPYIGSYSPAVPDLYVATGFNKWGMTSSMVAADILTDLILGKENPAAQLFRPNRSMLRMQVVKNAAEATANLLTTKLPRCPHLGCTLKWNPRERSWDCPCHGSRFSETGELLNNPATDDMNKA